MIHPLASRSRRALTVATVIAATCVLAFWALRHAGTALVDEDPLARADAIVVLAGTRMERPLEAADLYREGWAPLIVLTTEVRDPAERALERRGVHYPLGPELVRDAFAKIGVPPSAVYIVPAEHDSTADESRSIYGLATDRLWHRIIVVTSKLHTRRAGYAIRRDLTGLDLDVRMRASRYDGADPAHWWRARADQRFVLFEWQKLALYLLHLDSLR